MEAKQELLGGKCRCGKPLIENRGQKRKFCSPKCRALHFYYKRRNDEEYKRKAYEKFTNWRKKNKKRFNLLVRKWQKAHPEKVRRWQRLWRARKKQEYENENKSPSTKKKEKA